MLADTIKSIYKGISNYSNMFFVSYSFPFGGPLKEVIYITYDQATRWTRDESGVDLRQREVFFMFSTAPRTASGAYEHPI
jgi:hypothetical protein